MVGDRPAGKYYLWVIFAVYLRLDIEVCEEFDMGFEEMATLLMRCTDEYSGGLLPRVKSCIQI